VGKRRKAKEKVIDIDERLPKKEERDSTSINRLNTLHTSTLRLVARAKEHFGPSGFLTDNIMTNSTRRSRIKPVLRAWSLGQTQWTKPTLPVSSLKEIEAIRQIPGVSTILHIKARW
jgi:hypothetical protein